MKRFFSKWAGRLAVLLIVGAALCATGCTKAKADNGNDEYVSMKTFTDYETAMNAKLLQLDERLRAAEAAISELQK